MADETKSPATSEDPTSALLVTKVLNISKERAEELKIIFSRDLSESHNAGETLRCFISDLKESPEDLAFLAYLLGKLVGHATSKDQPNIVLAVPGGMLAGMMGGGGMEQEPGEPAVPQRPPDDPAFQ